MLDALKVQRNEQSVQSVAFPENVSYYLNHSNKKLYDWIGTGFKQIPPPNAYMVWTFFSEESDFKATDWTDC